MAKFGYIGDNVPTQQNQQHWSLFSEVYKLLKKTNGLFLH